MECGQYVLDEDRCFDASSGNLQQFLRADEDIIPEATRLFDELVASSELEEFLTLKAYDLLD